MRGDGKRGGQGPRGLVKLGEGRVLFGLEAECKEMSDRGLGQVRGEASAAVRVMVETAQGEA